MPSPFIRNRTTINKFKIRRSQGNAFRLSKAQNTPKNLSDIEKQQLPFEDKVKAKAKMFVASLPGGWGKGGADKMAVLILDALNTQIYCPYCKFMLSIKTISLDHKAPLLRAKVKRKLYNEEELKALNAQDNIHFICLKCNKIKREIPHDKYTKLLAFLEAEEMTAYVLDRLAGSNIVWMNSRANKKKRMGN
jgi:hypothetical protein